MRIALLALCLLAAADGGKRLAVPTRALAVHNLGASPVQLLLQQGDGTYLWGPFELEPQETLRVAYCPCAALALELRSPVRKAALRYPLTDISALLLSEDRWSEGEPIVRREGQVPQCDGPSTCEGPPFHIGR